MVTNQPIRQLVLTLAGKMVRGETLSDSERATLDGFRQAFPDLKNPVFVYCSKDDHKAYGVLLYDVSEPLDKGLEILRGPEGNWTCALCRNGSNIRVETVRIT